MNNTFNQSLAGTDRKYVVGQVKVAYPNSLHVQIGGTFGNRPYGFATNIQVDDDLYYFVKAQGGKAKSLASGTYGYIAAQFDVSNGNEVKIQLAGQSGNRHYGFTDTLEAGDLASYLQAVVNAQPAKAPAIVNITSMWQDDGEGDSADDTDNQESTNETIMELEESLSALLQLVKTAQEELATLKSKVQ